MVLLSIQNQVLIYTTLLSSLSYFCIFKPSVILKQGTILLLGDAMELIQYPYTAKSLAPAGFLFAVLAVIYLTIYLRDDMGFLSALSLLRFCMSFAIAIWSYMSGSIQVGNSLVFSFAFGDMVFQVSMQEYHEFSN